MRANKLLTIMTTLLLFTLPSQAQKAKKSKRTLARENKELNVRIDSLMQQLLIAKEELDQYAARDADTVMIEESPVIYDADLTDSLRLVWYVDRDSQGDVSLPDLEGEHFDSNVPDSIFIARLESINSFISLPFNETVRNYMILYSEKMPEKMSHIMGLSPYYMPIFEEALDRYGLPLELKIMAIIESALNPVATSKAGAKGIWQFMYRTGISYGLTINSFVDERMDVEKASDAAARYLSSSYKLFGDWILAIASYNCGSGNVNKAIRRAGGRRDFWSIYPYLPRETRTYVPAFVGALYAYTYASECGIIPEARVMPFEIDTFMIQRNLNLNHVATAVGVPVEDIRRLNPEYINDIIPGASTPSVLRLDLQHSGIFMARQDSIYASDSMSTKVFSELAKSVKGGTRIAYKVKNGDNLSKIASRYHVTVAQLKRWNGLKSDRLSIGQTLYIE